MSYPSFTAESSLYRSTGSYAQLRGTVRFGSGNVAAQDIFGKEPLGYACTSVACACSGSADCASCVGSGTCHGSYQCGSSGVGPEICIFGPH